MTPEFKAAVFDLDGTLLNTLEDLAASLNQALREEGLPEHDLDRYRFLVGSGPDMLVSRALPERLRIPAHVRALRSRFLDIYRANLHAKTRPYEGIPQMLAALKGRGLKLAVLSNKSHRETGLVVEHFFPNLFDSVQGLKPDGRPKPDPAEALALARGFGLDPGAVVYLGDSDVDMETALAAGFYPVGAAWGFRPVEELRRAGARLIAESPAAFAALAAPEGSER